MHIRRTKTAFILERSQYKPAHTDANGKHVPAVRGARYIFGLPLNVAFNDLPIEQLALLSESEKMQLNEFLTENGPWGDELLVEAADTLSRAGLTLATLEREGKDKLRVMAKIAKIDQQYEAFFRVAQKCGYKRSRMSSRSLL